MKWNIVVGSLVLGASLCTPSFAGGLLDKLLGLKGCGCDSTCCDTGCAADPSCGVENACGAGCGAGPSCGCESAPACGGGCGAAPSCGCESAPACGNGCGAPTCGVESACGAGPSCGCETAPSCGCETSCCKPRRKPLLELLHAVECKKKALISKLHVCKKGCDSGCCEPSCGIADPSCGCESTPACGSGCGAAPSCGCEIAAPCCDTGCGCGPKKCGLLSKLFKHKHKACCDSACDACPTAGCSSCSSCGGSAAAPAAEAAPMPPAPVVDPSAYLQSNRRVIQATSYVR